MSNGWQKHARNKAESPSYFNSTISLNGKLHEEIIERIKRNGNFSRLINIIWNWEISGKFKVMSYKTYCLHVMYETEIWTWTTNTSSRDYTLRNEREGIKPDTWTLGMIWRWKHCKNCWWNWGYSSMDMLYMVESRIEE